MNAKNCYQMFRHYYWSKVRCWFLVQSWSGETCIPKLWVYSKSLRV